MDPMLYTIVLWICHGAKPSKPYRSTARLLVGSPNFWKLQQSGRKLHKDLSWRQDDKTYHNPVCHPEGWSPPMGHDGDEIDRGHSFAGKNAAIYLRIYRCSFQSFNLALSAKRDVERKQILLLFILIRTYQGDKWGWFLKKQPACRETNRKCTWKLIVERLHLFPHLRGRKNAYFLRVFALRKGYLEN